MPFYDAVRRPATVLPRPRSRSVRLRCYTCRRVSAKADPDASEHDRLDGLFLVLLPDSLAFRPLGVDALLTFVAFGAPPVLLHHQAWFYGFQARQLLAGTRDYEEFEVANIQSPLDTLDYRVLQLVADAGGDPLPIMVNDIGVGHRDLLLRLKKLVVLRYIDAVESMHGPQLVLATKATDMLALPVSLFAWELDEPDLGPAHQ